MISPRSGAGNGRSASYGALGLCLFSLLAIAPAILNPFLPEFPAQDVLTALAYSIVLWSFWLAIWGNPLRGCIVATPLLLFTPIALYLALVFHAPLNPTAIAIMLESNREETVEFLRGMWVPVLLAYGFVLVGAAVSLCLMRRHPLFWTRRWRLCTLALVPLTFLALHLTYRPLELAGASLHNRDNPFRTTIWPVEVESVRPSAPFGVLLDLSDAIEGQSKMAQVASAAKNFRFGAKQTLEFPGRQVFILVIGESSRKDRWAINGYNRKTSPRLQREENLVTFSDVVTLVPATMAAVPVILTRNPPPKFRERSVVSAFKEAGFATYWLSNQSPLGYFDVSYAMYAAEADQTSYFNATGGWQHTQPDGVMLDPLRRILASSSEARQFIVIHTLGSHLEYRLRYPNAFDVFKPSLEQSDLTGSHDAVYRAKLNNAYDNSVLYSDFFLSEVLAAVKASGRPLATVLYLSDHGEDLYDDGCDLFAHGKLTVSGLRVPMFFWSSPAYERLFPDKIDMLKKHSTSPLTTQAVFPLLLDAAEIHFPGEDPTRSVMSPAFQQPAKRMVLSMTGMIDFDRAHTNAQCLLVE